MQKKTKNAALQFLMKIVAAKTSTQAINTNETHTPLFLFIIKNL